MSRNNRKCVICEKKEYGTYKAHYYFTTFPKEESRCKMWLRIVGKPELTLLPITMLHKNRYICSDHFEKKFMNKKGNRIKRTAIPTLKLQYPPLSDCQLSKFGQNTQDKQKESPKHTKLESAVSTSSNIDVNPVTSKPNKSKSKSANPVKNIEVNPESPTLISLESVVPTTSNIELNPVPESPKHTNLEYKLAVPAKRKMELNPDLTPRKKKLMERLRKTKCTLKSLKNSANMIEKLDSPVLKSIVLSANKNQNRKPQGRRWSIQNKISCLAILKRSAKTYKYLRHLIPLPSIKTLQSVLKKMPLSTGINNATIKHLASLASDKNDKEKICCLLFDEIALKPRLIYDNVLNHVVGFQDLGNERTNKVADHALVFMLQGVFAKFKQPIAVYFVKGTIPSAKLFVNIKEIINAVTSAGYRVIATVCDQGPTNMGAIKMLKQMSGQTTEDNWFLLNNVRHFIIYDVPHLFKSLRNNFQKNGKFLFDGKSGNWEHIVEIEKLNRNFLYLSKLSETHVNPKYRAKMKVKYAAQTLSNTVSAVLKLVSKIEEGKQNLEKANQLLDTALIIQELDCLFDLTNGPSGPKDIKKGYRQNVSNKTNHLLKWSEYIKKLKTLQFINKNGCLNTNVKCIQGYITTIKSLRDVWSETSRLGFKYLNLRQLNQDALENLFGLVRQHSPTNRNPTCYHFMIALKTSIITNMTAPHSRGSNCESDNGRLLTNFHGLIFNDNDNEHDNDNITNEDMEANIENIQLENNDEIITLSIPDEIDEEICEKIDNSHDHAAVYVSGCVASTILKKSTCENCRHSLSATNQEQDDEDMYIFIRLREWWPYKKSLTYPSKSLYSVIKQMVQTMEKNIIPDLYKSNIGHLTVTMFYAHLNTNWFKCSMHKKQIINFLYKFCSHLLIRRQCEIINKQFASQEESLADSVKKAQQFGKGV